MEENLDEFLYRNNLLTRNETAIWKPLAGGVSSDIWRVELPGKTICVKRALANLRVEADWKAPIERNNYEWEWFKFVHENFPGNVPRPIAQDAEMQMLAMEFLAPEDYTLWKKELLEGVADDAFARKVGKTLGQIHAKSAGDERIKQLFATDKLFFALRIEPYLLATAEGHPDISSKIKEIAQNTLAAKIALVHGDVSPKNILKGKGQPVFLDAETAWYGDPAFDLAFCLNHLLLKSVYKPKFAGDYLSSFHRLCESYFDEVAWEKRESLEKRVARLLPVLFLARIDGKSPAEYLTEARHKALVREMARKYIIEPIDKLELFAAAAASRAIS